MSAGHRSRRWNVLCRVLAGGGLIAAGGVAAACGTTAHAGTPASRRHAPVSSSVPANSAVGARMHVTFGTGSVGPPDPTTTVPTEDGRAIEPSFQAGQDVIITPSGFEPQDLEANVSNPVVWTNLSGRPVRIRFLGFPVDSGTIPVGGTFTWSTSSAVAVTYVATSGWIGKLEMNPVNP